jgi:hypothetical protein
MDGSTMDVSSVRSIESVFVLIRRPATLDIGSCPASSSLWLNSESVSFRQGTHASELVSSMMISADTIYLATYNYLGDVYDKYSVGLAKRTPALSLSNNPYVTVFRSSSTIVIA